MIGTLLRILTLAQLGAGARHAVHAALRQAAVLALACALLLAGLLFALAAGYLALGTVMAPVAAAAVMAGGLLAASVSLYALRNTIARSRPPGSSRDTTPLGETAVSLQEGARAAARNIGPVNVIALALLAGVAAGHYMRKS